ncbi:MAG: hypothetical protein DRJ03_22935 [Chloroflexi bacterium]|nr:MAG: hypothetical protein B6I35_11115 [Anaerolineaceae bacterium 4572_32.2]RLC75205.1 MAG: hypothetical protein DRI81_12490 [Chloroflexota bacterium]RLC79740.1 MAG: hypothetical protein DRJ03_22935 [Chloroflexota bacterium]HEY72570.1 DUF333 domain-containing protein [Thermoflexia bacterium]
MKNSGILLLVVLLLLVGCASAPTAVQPTAKPGMANPASVYCEEHGGEAEICTDDNGGAYGVSLPTVASVKNELFSAASAAPESPSAPTLVPYR